MASSLRSIIKSCNKRSLMQVLLKQPFNRGIVTSQQILSNTMTKKEDRTLVSLASHQLVRNYSDATSEHLTYSQVVSRVMESVLLFDKLDKEKVEIDSFFAQDLGLDSLDHVEIIMSIENEFGFFIPDAAAEKLVTPRHIVQYLCKENGVEVE